MVLIIPVGNIETLIEDTFIKKLNQLPRKVGSKVILRDLVDCNGLFKAEKNHVIHLISKNNEVLIKFEKDGELLLCSVVPRARLELAQYCYRRILIPLRVSLPTFKYTY